MADSLTALIRLLVSSTYIKDLDLRDPKDVLSKTYEQEFASGTGSGKANLQFVDSRELADGASESLDLAGSLLDAFGATLTFVKIKVLLIKNLSTTQTLSIGGAASTAWSAWLGDPTDVVKIGPGAMALLVCDPVGVAVGAGSTDLLKIANSAGAVCDYDIVIIGATA